MGLVDQLTIRENRDCEAPGSFSRDSAVALACCAVAVLLGAIHAFSARNNIGPDGISYLDISDLIRRGDWMDAVNAYWAPLYPATLAIVLGLLKPSAYWEFSAAQITNFLIYIGALGSFSFLLKTFIEHVNRTARETNVSFPLPRWLWLILGYTFFVWCSLELIGMGHVNPDTDHPDTLLSIFLYLAAALLLRIKMGGVRWRTYCCLGLVLGVGYLVKSPMFPLGVMFVLASVFAAGNLMRGLRLGLVAASLFLAISAPFVYRISKATGHLTFGDNAVINYTSNINQLPS